MSDPRRAAIPDVHGHAKGEHRPYTEERPIAYTARMLFLWFYHACRRASPRFLMVADHANYLTFEDPGAVNTVRRALKLAEAGDLLGAAETAGVEVGHAAAVSEGLRRGMRFSIGAEMDNDPRARPDAQNIIDALRPDGIIRSVHFIAIQHPEKGADWQWPFANEEFAELYDVVGTDRVWELYVTKLLDDLEKLPTHIVGHFYGPAEIGDWPSEKKIDEYEDRLLEVAHRRGLAVEINTRFLYRDNPEDRKKKYLDAIARFIRKAKARGVGIAIGSGAHSPKDQGNGFDAVLKLLDDAKVNEIVFPVGGRLARVALRATREHLEAEAQSRRQPVAPGSSITGYSRAELGLPEEEAAAHRPGRASREVGPKKRTSDSGRAAKRPQSAASTAGTSSRRSADSAASASKAKAARAAKPPPEAKASAAAPPANKGKKAAVKRTTTKSVATKSASTKSVATKSATRSAATKPTPAKPAAARPKKPVPARGSAKKKTAPRGARKTTGRKPVAKKAAAKKPAPRRQSKPKALPAPAGRVKKTAGAKKSVKKKKTAAKRR